MTGLSALSTALGLILTLQETQKMLYDPGVYKKGFSRTLLQIPPDHAGVWNGCLEGQPRSPSASSLTVLSCHRKLTELITQVPFHTSVILFGPH